MRMNPVLLKPTSDRQAQVVLMGKVATNMDAVSYHDYKPRLREQILAVYNSLAQEYDVIVLEGAGSPAEINLRDRDISIWEWRKWPSVRLFWWRISTGAAYSPLFMARWRCCINRSVTE
ncbi:cobyric acid synthase [Salmonella enterica subsp. enterica serovar Cerro str. FSL R8-0235]|nr:cobyric acid synthase [Salmonella enterica subsp. enterica serovar Cerro str. FSL R8-0235]